MLLCVPAFFAASCSTTPGSGVNYIKASNSNAAINGASFGGQFVPAGHNSTKFVLYAIGNRNSHDKLTVHGLSYRWSSGVTDTVPGTMLGKTEVFRNTVNRVSDRFVQATYHAPGALQADTARETSVIANADVSVTTRKGTERGTVSLRFDRSSAPDNHILTGSTQESMMEVRRYGVSAADLDIGANRPDWKP